MESEYFDKGLFANEFTTSKKIIYQGYCFSVKVRTSVYLSPL
jgi:hypothetical protein